MQQLSSASKQAVFHLEYLTARSRKTNLKQVIVKLIELLQDNGFRFVDILQALSDYAAGSSSEIQEEKPTWEIVAVLLQLAREYVLVREFGGGGFPRQHSAQIHSLSALAK